MLLGTVKPNLDGTNDVFLQTCKMYFVKEKRRQQQQQQQPPYKLWAKFYVSIYTLANGSITIQFRFLIFSRQFSIVSPLVQFSVQFRHGEQKNKNRSHVIFVFHFIYVFFRCCLLSNNICRSLLCTVGLYILGIES